MCILIMLLLRRFVLLSFACGISIPFTRPYSTPLLSFCHFILNGASIPELTSEDHRRGARSEWNHGSSWQSNVYPLNDSHARRQTWGCEKRIGHTDEKHAGSGRLRDLLRSWYLVVVVGYHLECPKLNTFRECHGPWIMRSSDGIAHNEPVLVCTSSLGKRILIYSSCFVYRWPALGSRLYTLFVLLTNHKLIGVPHALSRLIIHLGAPWRVFCA